MCGESHWNSRLDRHRIGHQHWLFGAWHCTFSTCVNHLHTLQQHTSGEGINSWALLHCAGWNDIIAHIRICHSRISNWEHVSACTSASWHFIRDDLRQFTDQNQPNCTSARHQQEAFSNEKVEIHVTTVASHTRTHPDLNWSFYRSDNPHHRAANHRVEISSKYT